MKPSVQKRIARLLSHDTSVARLIVATGLLLLGAGMALGVGKGATGYVLMEEAMPLQYWGMLYMMAGLAGMWGAVSRVCYFWRVALACVGIYLWALITLAQFADQLLPTRLLLILPAVVELWVLVKVVVQGKRGSQC